MLSLDETVTKTVMGSGALGRGVEAGSRHPGCLRAPDGTTPGDVVGGARRLDVALRAHPPHRNADDVSRCRSRLDRALDAVHLSALCWASSSRLPASLRFGALHVRTCGVARSRHLRRPQDCRGMAATSATFPYRACARGSDQHLRVEPVADGPQDDADPVLRGDCSPDALVPTRCHCPWSKALLGQTSDVDPSARPYLASLIGTGATSDVWVRPARVARCWRGVR